MFEIFLHAINRQDLFGKRSSADDFGALGNPALVAVLGVNLSDPASISITGRSYENFWMEIAEVEGFQMGLGGLEHGFSGLTTAKNCPSNRNRFCCGHLVVSVVPSD